mgnify:CR=1 FL=1
MRTIIAMNNLGFIRKGDKMLCHNKSDLQHFKEKTDGCTLLVGYRTAQGLPPLKNRTLLVIDRDKPTHSLKIVDWCIGGKKNV